VPFGRHKAMRELRGLVLCRRKRLTLPNLHTGGMHELGGRCLSPRFCSGKGDAAGDFESRRLNLTSEPLCAGRHFCLNRTSQVASAFRNSLVPSPAGCQLPT